MSAGAVIRCLTVSALVSLVSCCSTCNLTRRSDARQNDLLDKIVGQLGFDPNDIRVTDEMVESARRMVAQRSHHEEEHLDTMTIPGIIPTGTESSVRFKFSSQSTRRTTEKASISLHLRRPIRLAVDESTETEPFNAPGVNIDVFERRRDGTMELVATKFTSVPVSRSFSHHSLPLEVHDVRRWEEDGDVELYVVANYEGDNIVVMPWDDVPERKMTLVLRVSDAGRKRRNSAHCEKGSLERGCCLYDLVVDFEKLGWKFVIAPNRYNAFVCSGDCTLNHSTIYGRIDRNSATDLKNVCCHPAEYEPLDMIYLTPTNEVISARIPGMVVTKCNCG